MYALVVVDEATGEPRLASSGGALIVGTRDDMRRLSPRGALLLVPDGIGPVKPADELMDPALSERPLII